MAATSPDRILALDVIRGVAVMGIVSVNAIAFAMIEAAYFNPAVYGGRTGADFVVWAANLVLVDGKMRSLFSMLFGASMLLVIERAEAAGRSGWWTHLRRMAVLFGFGLLHRYFLWYGDILALYGACGLIAFGFRRLDSEKLLALGAALIIAQCVMFALFLAGQHQAELAAHAPGATDAAVRAWEHGLGSYAPSPLQVAEDRALYLGSYWGLVAHNLAGWSGLFADIAFLGPETVGLMLLGMAGYKSGFLTGEWPRSAYRRFARPALAVGALAGIAAVAWDVLSGFDIVAMMAALLVIGPLFMALMAAGYAALVILLSRRGRALTDRVAATGRCAFSNYLGTSLVASFVFHGWGLGLYGSLSRAQAWLVAPAIWALMLAWSKPWLDRFNYGPFEWAWRSLARWRIQPMRKIPPRRVAMGISRTPACPQHAGTADTA